MAITQTAPQAREETTLVLPPAGTYVVDPVHSTVGFVARHLVGAKVRGTFEKFSGVLEVREPVEASSVDAEVEMASVTTGQVDRDAHLRSGDFFDIENHPTMSLKSTGLKRISDTEFELATELTVRGVTRPVVFSLTYLGSGDGMAPGSTVVGLEASAEIDRRDFGVSFNRALDNGGLIVGNKVRIELDIEAHRM
jgi:polyisoprenoid-binding protein YceI